MSTGQRQVSDILRAASHLLDSEAGQDHNPKGVLNDRLDKFYASLSKDRPFSVRDTIEDLHLETVQCALETLEQVCSLLDVNSSTSAATVPKAPDVQVGVSDDAPVIGSRDLVQLRTLLSIIFRWGIDPLLARVSHAWPGKTTRQVGTRIVELGTPQDYHSLSSLLLRLSTVLLPSGPRGRLSQTVITTAILDRYLADFVGASIALGWLPKSLSSEDTPTIDDLRPVVLRLLEFVPLSQVIADLGAILSGEPPPAHVRRICSTLLSKSLLRERGINALFAVVFGEGGALEEPSLEKFEHVGRTLKTIPTGMTPEGYFTTIIPSILQILSEDVPATYKRAASFSIARMLDPEFPHKKCVAAQMLPIIHSPLRPSTSQRAAVSQSQHSTATSDGSMGPSQALSTIRTLLLNSDPSPVFITLILSPILPYLYALLYYLDKTRTSDPVLKDLVKALLATWGRVVECQEGTEQLWSIFQGQRVSWQTDDTGETLCVATESQIEKIALLSPEHFQGKEEYDEYDDAFDLYPNPTHFVRYIKSLDRPDINCELFVRLLEAYRSAKSDRESDPMRVLLYLQIIVQMQDQLSGDSSPQNILRQPEHVLQFIQHVLEPSSTTSGSKSGQSLGLADLRIIPEDEPSILGDSDSDDDERPEKTDSNPDEDMTETAISLLLATLEANPNLSARDAPILADISILLDPHANSPSPSIRSAVREARMVMTARLASTSTAWKQSQAKGESSQEVYQKALKLLQDPILPVRAHGLLLLRQLVSQYGCSSPDVASTEGALAPAILSIFMQAVQEDDSYIFLNAVQGLSAMVDTFGKGVLNSLLETYTHNLISVHGGYLTKQEVDTRVRVGEALGQVIRRCGDTLGKHVDTVVPRLISVFRARQAPVVLRASAISLLTQCIKTSFAAVAGYTGELSAAMIDLLQIEMVVPSRTSTSDNVKESKEGIGIPRPDADVDSTPTSIDPKLPTLRRSALHFLTLLMRTVTQATYEEAAVELPLKSFLKRAKATLGYISSADEDGITRAMAREADESINQLMKAMLGFE